jgi:hypothetical protein
MRPQECAKHRRYWLASCPACRAARRRTLEGDRLMDVTEYDDFPLFLDHTRPLFICAFGKKGSGKSAFNREIYRSWPYDKLAIDVNGHAEPGEDAEKITEPPSSGRRR